MNRNMRRKKLAIKFVIFFIINGLFLLSIYYMQTDDDIFSTKTRSKTNSQLIVNHTSHTENDRSAVLHGKPWPVLPSFLPWLKNPKFAVKSCEGYFGNGFTRSIDLLPLVEHYERAPEPSRGWFRCFYSDTLESSICEGGRIRMNTEKIRMSNGGEKLGSVIGRSEDDELPRFEPGAFEIGAGKTFDDSGYVATEEFLQRYMPQGGIERHTIRELISSIRVVDKNDGDLQCDQWIEDATILVTRFEYANLFHTVTDWYSAYVASRVTGLPTRPHVVFLDGHCKALLEETWEALFSSVKYAKHFQGSVCFSHAILSPLGYETALFRGLTNGIDCEGVMAQEIWQNPDDHRTARLSEFGEMLRASFDLPLRRDVQKPTGHNVLFIRRENYFAHPRHRGKVESRLSNEQEVVDSLKIWASNYSTCQVNFVDGLFAHMPMKEQFRAIGDASVIIGAHGAGLTHVIAAVPKTVVLELISSQFIRPHFRLISQWRGLEYHAINLPGSFAEPSEVIDRVHNILNNLGC